MQTSGLERQLRLCAVIQGNRSDGNTTSRSKVRQIECSPFPLLTASTLGASALVTATRLFTDVPLDALRRDPSALGHGQIWRLISPVLVQSDSSVVSVVLVFATCAAIGVYAEHFLSAGRWLTLYLCGALAGHGIGEAFQPLQGGTSVAFVGILGGLSAYALLEREPELVRWRPQAAIAIPLAILGHRLRRHPRDSLPGGAVDRGRLGPA